MSIVSVIVGTTRPGRFSDKPARWMLQHLKRHADIDAKYLDLLDYPMPFFNEPVSPATPGRAPYKNDVVQRWTAEIAASDAFVFVTAEYNHGYPAVLKNAMDWVYPEWNRKPVAFVSYGGVNGARAVEQLREVAVELQMAPIRSAVHVPVQVLMAYYQKGDVDKGLGELDIPASAMIDDLLWWSAALKSARSN